MTTIDVDIFVQFKKHVTVRDGKVAVRLRPIPDEQIDLI